MQLGESPAVVLDKYPRPAAMNISNEQIVMGSNVLLTPMDPTMRR